MRSHVTGVLHRCQDCKRLEGYQGGAAAGLLPPSLTPVSAAPTTSSVPSTPASDAMSTAPTTPITLTVSSLPSSALSLSAPTKLADGHHAAESAVSHQNVCYVHWSVYIFLTPGCLLQQEKTTHSSLSVLTTQKDASSAAVSPAVSASVGETGILSAPKGILRRGSSSSDVPRSPWQPPLSDSRPETRIVAEVRPLEIKQEPRMEQAPPKKVSFHTVYPYPIVYCQQ